MSQNGFVKSSADTSDKSICEAYPILNDHKSISFLDSVDKCKTDTYILQYFNDTDQDFYEFIKLHIEFDKLINSRNNISKFDINKELDNIKSILIQQNDKLSQLPFNIKDNLISLENNIRNVSNNDMKIIFQDFYSKIVENLDNDSNIKSVLDNFKDKLDNINMKTFNEFDQKTLSMMSSLHNNLQNMISNHSINDKIISIESILIKLHQDFTGNSSKKGEYAENLLHQLLIDNFKNVEIVDTHTKSNAGDFQLIMDNKPTILIDSKHFKGNVPKPDLQKFIHDIQLNNCSGILANCFGGIANKDHLEFEVIDNNVLVYIHEHNFKPEIFKVATSIIYYISDNLKNSNNQDKMFIDKQFFSSLKTEYNYFLRSFNEQLTVMKTSINTLSQLHFNMIEQFFSRKALSNDINKNIICTVCGSPFSSSKTLKQHMTNKHTKKISPTNSETKSIKKNTNSKKVTPRVV